MTEQNDNSEMASTEAVPEASDSPGGKEPDRPSRRGPAWLALLLALAALGLGAWQWYHGPVGEAVEAASASDLAGLAERLERVEARLPELADALAELDRPVATPDEVDELRSTLRALDSTLSGFERDLNDQDQRLRARMAALEERAGEQREADRDLNRRMLMLEAAALLRLGQERAELAADFDLAAAAFRRAGELLREADDPRLGQVRRDLARELETLESVERPDWLQIQSRLERLSAAASGWAVRRAAEATEVVATGEDPSAERGWTDVVRETFGQLVRVRTRDAVELGEEEIDLLRQQAVLRMTAAELAAGRRDSAELEHHFAAARRLLEMNFDPSAPAVAETLAFLTDTALPRPDREPLGLGSALAGLNEQLER